MGRRARNGTRSAIALKIIVVAAACLVAVGARPATAQGHGATGDLRGVVIERAGGPLAGVAVVVTNRATGLQRRAVSDARGRFAVAGLPVGTYDVEGALTGFAVARDEAVAIGIGQSVRTRLELRRAVLEETLTLAPRGLTIDPLRPSVSASFDAAEIAQLPNPSRDVVHLFQLTPFVSRDLQTNDVSVLGLPAGLNVLRVDGMEDRSLARGSTQTTRPARQVPYQWARDSVEEMTLTTTVPGADAGTGAAAFTQLATPAGGSRLSGSLFGQYRDRDLSAATTVDEQAGRTQAPIHAQQFGASLGGPLARTATFFVAYDGLRDRRQHTVMPNLPDRSPATAAGIDRLAASLADWPSRRQQDIVSVRVDAAAGAQRFIVRYSERDLRATGLDQGGELVSHESPGATHLEDRSAMMALGLSWGRLVNELRVGVEDDRDLSTAAAGQPQAEIRHEGALVLRAGAGASGLHDSRLRRWDVANTVMWAPGAHVVKAGAEVGRSRLQHQFGSHVAGAYVFQSLASFAAGIPSLAGEGYTQSFVTSGAPAARTEGRSGEYAGFVKDTWQLSSAFTLDLGLRYDLQTLDAGRDNVFSPVLQAAGLPFAARPSDHDNWSPHAGVAWQVSRKTVARAAFDVGYLPTDLLTAVAIDAYARGRVQTVTLGPSDSALPTYPASLAAVPASGRGVIAAFAPDLEQAQVRRASAGIEWQWMPQTSMAIEYLHATGKHLPRFLERNVGAASGPRLLLFDSGGRSDYDGVSLELRRRLWQGTYYRMGYALGRARDTVIATAFAPETQADRGAVPYASLESSAPSYADADQRHRFLMNVVFFTDTFAASRGSRLRPFVDDWRLSLAYSLQSGRPYSAYVSGDINGDGNRFNDLAPGTTRNQFRRPKEGRLDARLAREFDAARLRLTASADIFNVFNAEHARDVDDILFQPVAAGEALVRNPQFGRRWNPSDARTLQLGLSIAF